jgi:hypothetical protein
MADPNWEIFGRYIENEKAKHEASAKIQEAALLSIDQPLDGTEQLRTRLRLAHNRACVDVFTFVLTLAKTLIERGEQAEAEIAKLISQDG